MGVVLFHQTGPMETHRTRNVALTQPDIVITDFQMPRMDGLQLCRKLTVGRGERFVPIIMLTGGQDADLLHNSLEAGALEFLNKPIRPDELVARVRAIAAMSAMHPNPAARTLSSARRGRWSRISMGSVSAAITTTSLMPRFSVLVAAARGRTHAVSAASLECDTSPRQAAGPRRYACGRRAPSLAPFLSCL